MVKSVKEGQYPVKPEVSGGQHLEDHHHVLSGRTPGYGPFNHHQLIYLEWCLDMELIQS